MTRILYDLVGAGDVRFSPNCWRSRMALAHKGLEAEFAPVRFTEKAKIAFSGQKLVPVLKDGETVVCDSWAIACHLEDTYPDRPSLFGGPTGRGVTHVFSHWTHAVLHAATTPVILLDIHDALDPADRPYFRESREKRFGRKLEEVAADREGNIAAFRKAAAPLDAALAKQPWICGDAPAYGDYLVFGVFIWAHAVSDAEMLDKAQPLYGWRERMLDLYGGLARRMARRRSERKC